MNQSILKYLKNYSYDTKDVNRLLVSSFLIVNKIKNVKNIFINNFIISEEKELNQLTEFIQLFGKNSFDIEELIELFEFVISPQDKEVNGAVFTPEYIRKYIVKSVIDKQDFNSFPNLIFGDIACGCGGFFKTITEFYKEKTDKSYFEIYRNNIYGLDIQRYSVLRTKILLSLFAIINGEDPKEFEFNLYCGNALNFDWSKIDNIKKNNGFDVIVGNPPYVGASKMDEETKELLKKWSVSFTGKPDLYIPFFEIGMENLNENGILGYITVNTFYKSLNGRSVRNYFSTNQFDISIIDFGGEQLFKKRSTYTCICIIGKTESTSVKYLKSLSSNLQKIKPSNYINIPYANLDDFNGWYLINNKVQKIISKIENCGTSLGKKFEIRNGFATLKNNIYIFKPVKEDFEYYYLLKDGIEYKIEKGICRNAIKPNTLKSEEELDRKTEKLIFPYNIELKKTELFKTKEKILTTLTEAQFKINYPFAFSYLLTNKKILALRDKGNKKYDQWFSFGRNQALTLNGFKLLFPYITNKPCFVLTEDTDLFFYNGYAVLSESTEDLLILQKILMSKIFWYYIENTSKPYAGNYFSVAKNYIKNFGVCDLSKEERKKLSNLTEQYEIDVFLMNKYNIKI
ncbi:N-6 DNA methylase [Tenacibaculum finnmarkense]|uniref:Eco57I restriction-modification methylase domain-containing protein n=1 Tax=Tenacibaculum finnmarkense TaxID=2781243 RepID=UPI001E38A213|nr:N-6 DNA methylase [Tenacibaculum finnmarkense]MCD8422181.1 BREX-1 system adenine-specific DNA-methyltransferase PglX [Tenacibaculum finnmarkense genomovar ulcerans]MCG8239095.1 N-6 DNA methylase [Tenacibaculum finnmarkense genomovar ulcerans]MCG8748762.1 N-6 DNA methylase [Tenacibaculum finnmarkense]MCG8753342.1 N-6 DNA methylase [Tenacibaculum finnmarkense]MCG8782415.1 N-6 DNA methylase [Tenacibaculum finnmarkense]